MEPPKSSCSRCNEPTTQKCAACKSTYYCGSECQTKDWKDHKKNCKDLVMGKIIQRAGKIMQKLYLRFREDTFDACITKVVDKGNILEVYDDIKFSTRKNGWFAPFPHHLIKNERNKAAVLTAMCCNEPYAYFHDFLSIFLDSVNVNIQEVNVQLKAPARKTITVYSNGMVDHNNYGHYILRLTSKVTGTAWVIDITGGQYDIRQPTHKWESYILKYVKTTGVALGFGTALQYVQAMSQLKGQAGMVYSVGLSAMKEFDKGLESWCEQSGLKLSDLANLDDEKFWQAQKAILKVTRESVSTFAAKKNLTKARIKAERYDLRHPEEDDKINEIMRILGPSMEHGSCPVPHSIYLKQNN